MSAMELDGFHYNGAPARDIVTRRYPLGGNGTDALSPEIQEIIRYAQACLYQCANQAALAAAIGQIGRWRSEHPELACVPVACGIVLSEGLGTRMDPGAFMRFLLERQASLALRPHHYTALATLQEAEGLADSSLVGRKDTISPLAQHLTLKVARFHAATVLLRGIEEHISDKDAIHAVMAVLFPRQGQDE